MICSDEQSMLVHNESVNTYCGEASGGVILCIFTINHQSVVNNIQIHPVSIW